MSANMRERKGGIGWLYLVVFKSFTFYLAVLIPALCFTPSPSCPDKGLNTRLKTSFYYFIHLEVKFVLF